MDTPEPGEGQGILPFSLTLYIVTVVVIIIAAFVVYVIYWTQNRRETVVRDIQLPITEAPTRAEDLI